MESESHDIGLWHAEQLRLTAFLCQPLPGTEISWWEELVGAPPDNTEFTSKRMGRSDRGRFEKGMLVLVLNPARVDWRYVPLVDPEQLMEGFPSLGPLPGAIESFVPLMLRWLGDPNAPSIQRLAFGAILTQMAKDHRSAYALLGSYLPFVEVDPASSDLNFQVNRRRDCKSGIQNLQLNRLGKWSAAKMSLQMPSGEDQPIAAGDHFACRLELDINTSADYRAELPKERLGQLFEELVELGKEIASKGDVK